MKADHAPQYPGYKSACNGCGLCCLTVPCAVSHHRKLWRNGQCIALRFEAGRYWCNVINAPRKVSTDLAKYSRVIRMEAIGVIGVCDHRAAWSVDEAKALLAQRNVHDEFIGNASDTYPRSAIIHEPNQKRVAFQQTKEIDKVESGEKPHTIRALRKYPIKAGVQRTRRLHPYAGYQNPPHQIIVDQYFCRPGSPQIPRNEPTGPARQLCQLGRLHHILHAARAKAVYRSDYLVERRMTNYVVNIKRGLQVIPCTVAIGAAPKQHDPRCIQLKTAWCINGPGLVLRGLCRDTDAARNTIDAHLKQLSVIDRLSPRAKMSIRRDAAA